MSHRQALAETSRLVDSFNDIKVLQSNTSREDNVISPFANRDAIVSKDSRSRSALVLWICGIVLLLVVGAVGGVFATRLLSDPYRNLEVFPVAKYLELPRALIGSKFRGELRVEADLGWKENVGKLMLFSTSGDTCPVAIMVPASVTKDLYFTKGQTYLAELEVKDGGLIYANSCRKN